jgi:hypothetical protein
MAEKLVEICAIASECNNRNKNEVNFLWLDILFCPVSFCQRKVSVFKPLPRHNRYLLRFVSAK